MELSGVADSVTPSLGSAFASRSPTVDSAICASRAVSISRSTMFLVARVSWMLIIKKYIKIFIVAQIDRIGTRVNP